MLWAQPYCMACLAALVLQMTPASAGAAAIGSYERDFDNVRKMITEKRLVEAENLLNDLLRRHGDNPELLASRGRVRIWSGNKSAGMDDLRKTLAVRDDAEVRRMLVREEAAAQVRFAEELLKGGAVGEAEALLRTLLRSSDASYEAGLLLGRHYRTIGDSAKAAETYAALSSRYPADYEIAYLQVRALAASGNTTAACERAAALPDSEEFHICAAKGHAAVLSGKADEAAGYFRRALAHREDGEIRAILENIDQGLTIKLADRAMAEGRDEEAEKLLRPLYDRLPNRYEAGYRLAKLARKRGDFVTAAAIVGDLRRAHPADRDLRLTHVDVLLSGGRAQEALAEIDPSDDSSDVQLRRARVLYRLHRYREAVEQYVRVANSGAAAVADELASAEKAVFMEESLSLMRSGRVTEGEALWQDLLPERRDRYADGYMLGMSYFQARDFSRAAPFFAGLSREFPADPGLFALAVEGYLLNGERGTAAEMVATATPERQKYLTDEREDLLYRIRSNYVKASALVAGYDNGAPVSSEYEATVAGKFTRGSYAFTAGTYNRFNKTDTGVAGEVGFPLAGRVLRGTVGASFAPGAAIIPRYAVRTELTHTLPGGHEASIGYSRLSFRNSDVNIVVAGLLGFVSPTLSVNERLYMVPASGSWALASTVHYEKHHRLRSYYTLALGTAAEQLREVEGYRRYLSISNRVGTEFRPVAAWSAGGELFQEYRNTLYSRYGSQLYVKYWW